MSFDLEMSLRILLAGALGAAVGYQRERVGKATGLRTLALIGTGSALLTIVSINGFGIHADPSRVAAGVVVGIGFLGAGNIIRRREIVEGLTTAATVWMVAAIGLAVGAGYYLISAVTTAIVLGILFLPHKVG